MRNRVGSHNPSVDEVAERQKEVQHASAQSSAYLQPLSTEERKRTLKFRPGGNLVVALVRRLATKYDVNLPGVSVEDMTNDMDLWDRLVPLSEVVHSYARAIDDTILLAQSEAWWAATAYYTVLCRLAKVDPSLAAALEPAIAFFAHGPRTPKPPPSPTPSPRTTR